MPSPRYTELMGQLEEQLLEVARPFGVPVHHAVEASLKIIADLFQEIEDPVEPEIPDLTELKKAVEELKVALGANTAQDQTDQEALRRLTTDHEALATKLDAFIQAIDEKIGLSLKPLQEQQTALDQRETERHQELLNKIIELEVKIRSKGITEQEAQALIEANLLPVKATIEALQVKDTDLEQRIAAIKSELERLETLLDEKISSSRAQDLIDASILPLQQTDEKHTTDINALTTRVAELENNPGVTEARAREIAQEELVPAKAELTQVINTKADQSALADKADKSDLDQKADKTALALKADQSALADKADKSDLDQKADKTALALKADQSALADKADKSDLDQKADKTALALKADQSALADKADKSDLEQKADKTALALKADQSALADKADKSDLEQKADKTALALKADQSALADKADKSDLEQKADKTALELKADKTALASKANQPEIGRLDLRIDELNRQWLRDGQNSPDVRLARLCLQGWGIVGGLEISSDDKDYITITPGIGVSPAGSLIIEPGLEPSSTEEEPNGTKGTSIAYSKKKPSVAEDKPSKCKPVQPENLLFSHYRIYPNTEKYSFFQKSEQGETYPVWELLAPSDDLTEDALPLTPQTDFEYELPFIADKIILLYTSEYLHNYLLMRRQDVLEQLCCLPHQCKPSNGNDPDYLYEEEYSPEDEYVSDDDVWACLHPADRLPEIPLFRFGFFTAEECEPDELDNTSFPTLTQINDFYTTWRPIIEDAITQLERAIDLLLRRYHATLFPLQDIGIVKQKLAELSEKWTHFTVSNDPPQQLSTETGTKYYAQYFYDWLRDLIAGYHELRWELIALMNDLKPYTDETLAKQYQHLLLGPAQQLATESIAPPLRDHFRQPPVFNDNARRLETCRLYYQRLFQMIDGFYLENYAPKSNIPAYCYREDEEGGLLEVLPQVDRLRVTPGKSYIYPLSQQSIPYYYPLLDHPQSLQHYWDYRRSKNRSTDRILSYHATDSPPDFPSYSMRKEVVRPLHYALDSFDFYRIEGHIGKSTVRLYPKQDETDQRQYDVYEALQYLIRKYNLDFTVLKLSIVELQKAVIENRKSVPPYYIGTGASEESAQSFTPSILGAEHLGGVPKGGTFILVYENLPPAPKPDVIPKKKTVSKVPVNPGASIRYIADFSLPYRCCPPNDTSNS